MMKPIFFCHLHPKLERCQHHCTCHAVTEATSKAWRGQKRKVVTYLDNLMERDPEAAQAEIPALKEILAEIDRRIALNEEKE